MTCSKRLPPHRRTPRTGQISGWALRASRSCLPIRLSRTDAMGNAPSKCASNIRATESMDLDGLADALVAMGCPPQKSAEMAAQLDKRAKQLASQKGRSYDEA